MAQGQDLDAPAGDTHTLKVPHPLCLPDGGVDGTRKATSSEVASYIFGAGEKERLKFVWGLR